ncbi:MAG: tetratricopeptide repeat protein [Planctomycetota bacterium]
MKLRLVQQICSPWAWTLVILTMGFGTWIRQGRAFWVDADRLAQRFLDADDPGRAAETFIDPRWRGIAEYRAGDFKKALQTFSTLAGPDQRFNQANALVMLGRYEDAVDLYQQVLDLQPDRNDAMRNLDIARGRAERLRDEGGQMTDGKLEADEIVYEPMKDQGPSGDSEQADVAQLTDEEMRGLWLRQVQTTPGDFLRAKFAYQVARQNEQNVGASNEDD